MHIHPIEINLPLPDDQLVELIFVQWRTPIAEEEGIAPSTVQASVAHKRAVLQRLAAWVSALENTDRPLFILVPEISTPECCLNDLEQMMHISQRPMVIVAGIEHLEWPGYRCQVTESQNPHAESWLDGGDEHYAANVAMVWIRDADGGLAKYVQPKLHPADVEQVRPVYAADSVLVFRHRDPRPGFGLNFCVQICSDFCDADFVSTLRRSITNDIPDEVRLDLTLLIQCNPDQDAAQFRDATNAYFDPPDRAVDTSQGTLLLVNNASQTRGKSRFWGRSQFRFPYGSWRPFGGEPTFWTQPESSENWQGIVLRECGPCVYRLLYRPHYLVSRRPGSGQALPLREAGLWPIPDEAPASPEEPIVFSPIPAVIHWLTTEWNQGLEELPENLNRDRVHTAVQKRCLDAYRNAFDGWREALGTDDLRAVAVVRTFFSPFKGKKDYPYWSDKAPAREPNCWSPNAGTAIKRLMEVHGLLAVGASLALQSGLAPRPALGQHGLLEETIPVTYLWGGNERSARSMVTEYSANAPPLQRVSEKLLVVLTASKDGPEEQALANAVTRPITQATPVAGTGHHLRPSGKVTRGELWHIGFIYAEHLMTALGSASTEQFDGHLSTVIRDLAYYAI